MKAKTIELTITKNYTVSGCSTCPHETQYSDGPATIRLCGLYYEKYSKYIDTTNNSRHVMSTFHKDCPLTSGAE